MLTVQSAAASEQMKTMVTGCRHQIKEFLLEVKKLIYGQMFDFLDVWTE